MIGEMMTAHPLHEPIKEVILYYIKMANYYRETVLRSGRGEIRPSAQSRGPWAPSDWPPSCCTKAYATNRSGSHGIESNKHHSQNLTHYGDRRQGMNLHLTHSLIENLHEIHGRWGVAAAGCRLFGIRSELRPAQWQLQESGVAQTAPRWGNRQRSRRGR